MKFAARQLALLILALGAMVGAAEKADRPGWKLTFQDEFDGTALNLKNWSPNDPWGRERNRELQAYVTNAFEVHDGILRAGLHFRHDDHVWEVQPGVRAV